MALEKLGAEHEMESADYRSTSALFTLWFAMLGGPFATAIVTGVNYATVSRACENESSGWLYFVNGTALLIAIVSLVTSYTLWKRLGGGESNSKFGVIHRGKFMVVVGLMSSSLAILGILMEMYPIFVMGPCIGS